MTISRLLMCLFVVMLISLAKVSGDTRTRLYAVDDANEYYNVTNNINWELVKALANSTRVDSMEIWEMDVKRHRLWETYRKSPMSERSKIVEEINEALAHMEYVNSRIQMVGLLLFGPAKGRSTIRSVRATEHIVDDWKCLKSTLESFEKHCCLLPELGLRQIRAFANICNYVADKAAIKEALNVACGVTKIKKYAIDVSNPSVEVTPAPVRGSHDEYCARVSVTGTSRMNLESYAKAYRVLLVLSPLVRQMSHYKVQICFHRDSSMGLCHCAKDDWKSLENGMWSSLMSPYEHKFVDVMYTQGIYGPVTVSVEEVSERWRYALLAVGILLLFLARGVSKYSFPQGVDYFMADFIQWVMCVIAIACIFKSSIDTLFAMLAAVTCLAAYYEMTYIKKDLIVDR